MVLEAGKLEVLGVGVSDGFVLCHEMWRCHIQSEQEHLRELAFMARPHSSQPIINSWKD